MLLKELKQIVDLEISRGKKETDVVATVKNEAGLGARAFVGVKNAWVGFDWEAGQFRIETSEPVCRLGCRYVDPQPMWWHQYIYPNKKIANIYCCPKCEHHLKKTSKYCDNCGQAVQLPEKPTITTKV